MRCPRCPDIELQTDTTLGGVEADLCPSCKGLWLDGDELSALLGSRAKRLDHRPGRAGEVACPRCDLQWLELIRFPGSPTLDVDRCPDCRGVWLDAGELGALRGRLAVNAVEKSVPVHPLDEEEVVEPPSAGKLALGWAFFVFVAVAPLLGLRHVFPGWVGFWWLYPIVLVGYVYMGGLFDPSFDRNAMSRYNRPGLDVDDFSRATGYLVLFLLPGRLMAWTVVRTWERLRGGSAQ